MTEVPTNFPCCQNIVELPFFYLRHNFYAVGACRMKSMAVTETRIHMTEIARGRDEQINKERKTEVWG